MDDFVCNKLTQWGFSDLIERFKDELIDKETLLFLEDQDIDNLISKVGRKAKFRRSLKLLKEELKTTNLEAEDVSDCQQEHQEAADSAQAGPSTRALRENSESRLLDFHGELPSPPKRRKPAFAGSYSEEIILSKVKTTMRHIYEKLHLDENTKLNAFVKNKICDLENNKRELVGVFGKTGAGKSSLINTIIGEYNLLPSGGIKACTSVMIKVETNMDKLKYEAEIEFIPKEDWKDEIWSLNNILENNEDKEENEKNEDYRNIVQKLSAVYGEEWSTISPENLMEAKYFKETPEFLRNAKKRLACESAEELSTKLSKYTISESSEGAVKRWYWPLVKCVTVRVPNNPLLQHVTLVDLPGNGDDNKSRDKMWKELVGSCSTVWIVTEINRAASESEAWEILKSACSLIGNGGQCQQIHFICTKTDHCDNWNQLLRDAVRGDIFKRNMKTKDEVQKKFNTLNNVKKHFSDGCFKVFTVSAKLFLKGKRGQATVLQPDETEIPKLHEFLQNLNDCHSETLNYVSGAYGILSLMQGARSRDTADGKTEVCPQLEETLQNELHKIRKTMGDTYEAFKDRLTDGVKNSESSCEETLRKILYPRQKDSGFHYRTLKCVVENSGVHKTTKGKLINLNADLSSKLTGSIDEMFRNTFPNEGKPFNGVISAFSLDTEKLIEKYKAVELQLVFLGFEEEKIKTRLIKIIRDRKKTIYSSLTEMIKDTMDYGYKKAAEVSGQDALKNMKETLEKHVQDSKTIIFELAKSVMLQNLQKLEEEILETLEQTLNESIELSLKTSDHFIPDFSTEFDRVKQFYRELTSSQNEEM
ncbi:nuclear GTPase SLIP-GC-like [Betta splendens]|uniref:Nuclear GTPase SLIP-GC-like n=1 Tax=Betta splendens TaxID=158456 RepID=A0A6P7N7H3_BETSP|nr:nuclear GTPase SLIP-GC-like [Betta splendens]XP_029015471.1 nuclear GTPase SLIP-GC-like [Betta splendens]